MEAVENFTARGCGTFIFLTVCFTWSLYDTVTDFITWKIVSDRVYGGRNGTLLSADLALSAVCGNAAAKAGTSPALWCQYEETSPARIFPSSFSLANVELGEIYGQSDYGGVMSRIPILDIGKPGVMFPAKAFTFVVVVEETLMPDAQSIEALWSSPIRGMSDAEYETFLGHNALTVISEPQCLDICVDIIQSKRFRCECHDGGGGDLLDESGTTLLSPDLLEMTESSTTIAATAASMRGFVSNCTKSSRRCLVDDFEIPAACGGSTSNTTCDIQSPLKGKRWMPILSLASAIFGLFMMVINSCLCPCTHMGDDACDEQCPLTICASRTFLEVVAFIGEDLIQAYIALAYLRSVDNPGWLYASLVGASGAALKVLIYSIFYRACNTFCCKDRNWGQYDPSLPVAGTSFPGTPKNKVHASSFR